MTNTTFKTNNKTNNSITNIYEEKKGDEIISNEYMLYCYLCLEEYDKLSQKEKDFLDDKLSYEEFVQEK